MYIEFSLRNVTVVGASARDNYLIDQALDAWSNRYQIPYRTKTVKYKKRVTFDSDESYSLFAMTWNPDRRYYALSRWCIVSDLNNKI